MSRKSKAQSIESPNGENQSLVTSTATTCYVGENLKAVSAPNRTYTSVGKTLTNAPGRFGRYLHPARAEKSPIIKLQWLCKPSAIRNPTPFLAPRRQKHLMVPKTLHFSPVGEGFADSNRCGQANAALAAFPDRHAIAEHRPNHARFPSAPSDFVASLSFAVHAKPFSHSHNFLIGKPV